MSTEFITSSDRSIYAQNIIKDYLASQSTNDLLRFITCGSVDDGKSTLIGRLLYEAKCLFEDQVTALKSDSVRFGTQAGNIDFALLVDGLSAEREQGITIDVAYRYFKTDKRNFIVADTPGHEQYTRNMVTGASTADAAVLLIDARHGVLPQTRRHAFIVSLLGVKSIIVAINKMDLMGYSQSTYEAITDEFKSIARELSLPSPTMIPVSALLGDNIIAPSRAFSWYQGPTLVGALESIPTRQTLKTLPFRMNVQWVNRPHLNFRGVSGTICAGELSTGDEVRVLPSGQQARVARIVTYDRDLEHATTEQAITLVFDREIDASRGNLICAASQPCEVTTQLNTYVVWMHEEEGICGRPYLLKIGSLTVVATLIAIKHVVDIQTYGESIATTLKLNDIARVYLKLDQPIPFEPYATCPPLGSFILIDKRHHATMAAGMIQFALRRATNIHRHHHTIDMFRRQELKGHRGVAIWLTGLSGSGKSTLAEYLERILYAQGVHTYLLDGDNIRHGLNRDLGFTLTDRVENIRRVSEVAHLMVDAGLVVIAAFISPYREDRQLARELFDQQNFIEVYVNTPLEVAERRDPKGLYKKARAGKIPNFTGIGSPYEPPLHPEIIIDTTTESPEQSALRLYKELIHQFNLGGLGEFSEEI